MRAFLVSILVASFVISGTAQSKGRADKPFVVLEFPDLKVSVFVLGEGDLSMFHTKGTNVEVLANCHKRLLKITGDGEISYKAQRFGFSKRRVSINGKDLPEGVRNFVLTQNGEIHEGFIRGFDLPSQK